jgi:hypothetical protein
MQFQLSRGEISMSPVFQKVIDRLGKDLTFAGQFLNSPALALEGYNLEPTEFKMLVSRDLNSLQKLGLSEEQISAVGSGAHSKQCPS